MTESGRRRDQTPPCLVVFHAHPDDEAIFTGGTIAIAVAAGWRVVLVVATSGEEGVSPDWLTGDLGRSRRAETMASARILGIDRVEFLGYWDSGAASRNAESAMARSPHSGVLTLDAAPIDAPVPQLRRILTDEGAAALSSYDSIGIYGHRDHIRVHEIAAAAVVGTRCDLIEATISREALRRLRQQLLGRGLDPLSWPQALVDAIGTEDTAIAVDVSSGRSTKLAAMAAHATQVVEAASFMGLPPGAFHRLLDVEWFRLARTIDGRLPSLLETYRHPTSADTPDAQLYR